MFNIKAFINRLSNSNTGLRWLWLSFLILLLDFSSKQWIVEHLFLGESIFLLPCLNFFYVCNFGVVFGLLDFQTIEYQCFLIVLSSCIIFLFLFIMYHSNYCYFFLNISYAMIVGGGLGNLVDRIFRGMVIDFIDFHLYDLHWPIFNFADLFVCVGIFLIMLNNSILEKY